MTSASDPASRAASRQASRRDVILDAAIAVLGTQGVRGLTHRAVDAAAELPPGSTSNYFRTSEALFEAVVERFALRERQNWEEIALSMSPATPSELVTAFAVFVRDSVAAQGVLTLARYVVLVEAAIRPSLRPRLLAARGRVNQYFTNWLRVAGVPDPSRAMPIVANYITGLVLHQMAMPDPDFDPEPGLRVLIHTLLTPAGRAS